MKREVLKAAAILFAIVALSFLLGFVTARMSRTDVQERIERDTTIYVDTIAYYKPVPKDSIVSHAPCLYQDRTQEQCRRPTHF